MNQVSRDRVRDLAVQLNEWHKYIDQMRSTGATSNLPAISREEPQTIAKARELAADLENHAVSVPHLRTWLDNPDGSIPDDLMVELGNVAMDLPRRNGLSFAEAVRRKKSPQFQELIRAVRDAIPHLRSRYARDEEMPLLFDRLLDPSLKTINGSTMHVTLEHLHRAFDRERENHPALKAAASKLAAALRHRQ
jgi:hypothetical protein